MRTPAVITGLLRAALVVLGIVVAAAAEDPSTLAVRVLDPTGAAVPGARVVLSGRGPAAREAATDERGEASFRGLEHATYRLHIEAEGFARRELPAVPLSPGDQRLEVALELARRSEEVVVAADQGLARERSFTRVLTEEDVAQLPDDPEEMAEMLRHMAGPGAVLRVNGFAGGRLPPKSQIRQIRFQTNPYAAENHQSGTILVDILTKPGLGSWRTSLSGGFRGHALSARPALSDRNGPQDYGRFAVSADGPLRANHTSLFVSLDGRRTTEARAVQAVLPGGPVADPVKSPLDRLDLSARVEHLWGAQTLRAEYQRNAVDQQGLGAGGLDLPERAFEQRRTENLLRLANSGVLGGKKLVGETRLQLRWEDVRLTPLTDAPTVQVMGAFTAGGAQSTGSRRVRELEAAHDLDASWGRHALRAGLLFEGGRYRSDQTQNARGTFTFPDLASYEAGRPALFTRREGDPLVRFGQWRLGLYLQDEIRVSSRLSVGVGLRPEALSTIGGGLNPAPRLGLTWSVGSKTTLRAGAGVFNEWLDAAAYEASLRVDGHRQRAVMVQDPGFPDPMAGGSVSVTPPGRLQMDPGRTLARTQRVSLGLERAFAEGFRWRMDYAFERGLHQYGSRNLNTPGPGRPDPSTGNVLQLESTGRARHHVLSTDVHYGRPDRPVSLLAYYVFSSARDEADGPWSSPADAGDPAAEWGPAVSDVRHRGMLFANVRVRSSLRLTTMLRAQSGFPYEITTGRDEDGDGLVRDRPRGIHRNAGRGQAQIDLGLRLSWARGFGQRRSPAGPGRPRAVRVGGDGEMPDIPMPGDNASRYRLQLALQAYNALNRVNAVRYAGVVGSPLFGRPTAALAARRLELAATLGF